MLRLHLSETMQQTPGSVLYTPLSNVKAASVYIMGLNPGGHPADRPTPIIDSLAPAEGESFYTHECWQKHCAEPQPCSHLVGGKLRADAQVPHQSRMHEIAKTFDMALINVVCCNAIFGKSEGLGTLKAQTGFSAREWWSACWPVHQYLLKQVRPGVIITLGYGEHSSAFGLLRREAGHVPHRPIGEVGVGGGRTFDAKLPLGGGDVLEVAIVGVPHPSWHGPGQILKDQLWELGQGMLN